MAPGIQVILGFLLVILDTVTLGFLASIGFVLNVGLDRGGICMPFYWHSEHWFGRNEQQDIMSLLIYRACCLTVGHCEWRAFAFPLLLVRGCKYGWMCHFLQAALPVTQLSKKWNSSSDKWSGQAHWLDLQDITGTDCLCKVGRQIVKGHRCWLW